MYMYIYICISALYDTFQNFQMIKDLINIMYVSCTEKNLITNRFLSTWRFCILSDSIRVWFTIKINQM